MTTPSPEGLQEPALREALEQELGHLRGSLPVCPDWMYTAVRHCQRNMDVEPEEGFNEPGRQIGGSFARIANMLPEIIEALSTPTAQPPAAETRLRMALEEAKRGFEAVQVLLSAMSNGRPSIMVETFMERADEALSRHQAGLGKGDDRG